MAQTKTLEAYILNELEETKGRVATAELELQQMKEANETLQEKQKELVINARAVASHWSIKKDTYGFNEVRFNETYIGLFREDDPLFVAIKTFINLFEEKGE